MAQHGEIRDRVAGTYIKKTTTFQQIENTRVYVINQKNTEPAVEIDVYLDC